MKQTIVNTKLAFEDKLVRVTLIGALMPVLIALVFIFSSELSVYLKILLTFTIIVSVAYAAFTVRQQVIFQLRTSTNLVEAMTSGDYSLRANNKHIEGALSDFNQLLNNLASRLAEQSLITREKQILLTKVTDQIDVAVVASDHHNNISLMNPAAERLFKRRFDEVEGWPIKTLGLQNVLAKPTQTEDGTTHKTISEFEIDHDKRKVYVHTDSYFELSHKHHLIFITDIQHLLRNEERLAWQRLLRVLSHEINNSLTPIASVSETLHQIVSDHDKTEVIPKQQSETLREGLSLISERAHSLNHFIQDYQQLTRLPQPNKIIIELRSFLASILQLFEKTEFILPTNDIDVFGDSEQLQQVFVNLIKNAVEANSARSIKEGLQRPSRVILNWYTQDKLSTIIIEDEGLGITNTDNLFVPFYTTKKQGSGIGLTLSRQIALNHGGDLTLTNRINKTRDEKDQVVGARASLILPNAKP